MRQQQYQILCRNEYCFEYSSVPSENQCRGSSTKFQPSETVYICAECDIIRCEQCYLSISVFLNKNK